MSKLCAWASLLKRIALIARTIRQVEAADVLDAISAALAQAGGCTGKTAVITAVTDEPHGEEQLTSEQLTWILEGVTIVLREQNKSA